MKLSKVIITLLLTLALGLSLASCDYVTGAIDEATAPLKESIEQLEETKEELENAKATLEAAKAELEAAKERLEDEKAALLKEGEENSEKIADLDNRIKELEEKKLELEEALAKKDIELACAKGEHTWDGESLVRYRWSSLSENCTVLYNCMYCDEEAYEEATSVTTNEDGELVAEFEAFPSDTFSAPVFTGVSFNTDSPAYSSEEGRFYVTEENPLVITFTGEGLHRMSYDYYFRIGAYCDETWVNVAYTIDDSDVKLVDENTMIYTFDYDSALNVLRQYGSADGFVILDDSWTPVPATLIYLTAKPERPELDDESYMLVKTEEELQAALAYGGRVRLGADIVGTNYIVITTPMLFDFAGHSLTFDESSVPYNIEVSLHDCTFIDSVGGSYTNYRIVSYSCLVKIQGDISFNEEDCAIIGSGSFDLSEYTGGELLAYRNLSTFDVILPEGYAFYDLDGNKYLSLADMPADAYYIWVRLDGGEEPVTPDDTSDEWTTVYTVDDLLANITDNAKIKLGDDIDLGASTVDLYYDVKIDLNGKTVRTSDWAAFDIYQNYEVTLMNGTIENTGEMSPAVISSGYLTVDNCTLIGNEYYALTVCQNTTTVKNSTLNGGVDVQGNMSSSPILDAVENVTIIPCDKFGVSVYSAGQATFSFDPTNLFDLYNEGTVTDNGDGTYTVVKKYS